MADEEPWDLYDRGKLPKGWAYPIGRDAVSTALVSADVHLNGLIFSMSALDASPDVYVLWVRWPSDAEPNRRRDPDSNTLWLSVRAVPSTLRQEIGHQLSGIWLEKALAWAQQAPHRGNAWTATDHDWYLIRKPDGRMILEET
jgi:hypothetical protein